jgi:hypothetical protein
VQKRALVTDSVKATSTTPSSKAPHSNIWNSLTNGGAAAHRLYSQIVEERTACLFSQSFLQVSAVRVDDPTYLLATPEN